jgi:hypothetical protein
MNKKEALKTIETNLRDGQSKKDVFNELSSQIANTSDLKNYLAMIPDQESRNKYYKLNSLLMGSIALYILWKICFAFLTIKYLNSKSIPSLILFDWIFFILPIIIFTYGCFIWKFRGPVYNLLCFVCIFDMCFYFFRNSFSIIASLIYMFPIILVFFLAFYISRKVFPYYKWNGTLDYEKFIL